MPPLFAAGGFIAAIGQAIFSAVIAAAVSAGINAITGTSSSRLRDSFNNRISSRTLSQRAVVTPHRYIFGEGRYGGAITYMDTSTDDVGRKQGYLHIVYTVAAHEVARIGNIILGDYPIFSIAGGETEQITSSGRYANHLFWGDYRGDPTGSGAQWPQFSTDTLQRWGSDHEHLGRAGIHLRMKFNGSIFRGTIPNASFFIQGNNQIFDVRDSSTGWTPNVALCVNYVLELAVSKGGMGLTTAEINQTALATAANICDEFVTVNPVDLVCDQDKSDLDDEVERIYVTDNRITIDTHPTLPIQLQTGDRIQLPSELVEDRLPGGLTADTNYYIAVIKETNRDGEGKLLLSKPEIRTLTITTPASGSENATVTLNSSGTVVAITAGTEAHNATELAAAAYTGWSADAVGDTVIFTADTPGIRNATYSFSSATALGSIVRTQTGFTNQLRPGQFRPEIALHTTYAGALGDSKADNSAGRVNITSRGDGKFTIRKTAEPRYALNYSFTTDQPPHEILGEMLSAMDGKIIPGEKWRILAGAYITPTLTFDEDDLAGPITVQTKFSRRDQANSIQGLYVDPQLFGEASEYPKVVNALGLSEDTEDIPMQFDLAGVSRVEQAQRLASIKLARLRQPTTFSAPFKLTAMQLQDADTFMFTNARFGWSSKVFEVIKWELDFIEQGDAPLMVVKMTCQETVSTIYDSDFNDLVALDPAPNTELPSPFFINPPSNVQVIESLVSPNNTTIIPVATVSWAASPHAFTDRYQVEYKLNTDSTWITAGRTEGLSLGINDLVPGLYDFRVKAMSRQSSSEYTGVVTQEISGLGAKPEDPTGLTAQVINGIAFLTWNVTTSLDVIIGGQVEIRHDQDTTTGDWTNSVPIGPGTVPGVSTGTQVPVRDGHILVKFVDSGGNKSANPAFVKVLQHSLIDFNAATTITEDPGFSGVKTQMVVVSTNLTLDVDGGGDVLSTGTYEFANDHDAGSIMQLRITPDITVTTLLDNDQFDDRTDNIDDWLNFDGVEGSEVNARIEFRHTPDDPTGSPTWSSWENLDTAVVEAWGLEFRVQFINTEPTANIQVSALSIDIEEAA